MWGWRSLLRATREAWVMQKFFFHSSLSTMPFTKLFHPQLVLPVWSKTVCWLPSFNETSATDSVLVKYNQIYKYNPHYVGEAITNHCAGTVSSTHEKLAVVVAVMVHSFSLKNQEKHGCHKEYWTWVELKGDNENSNGCSSWWWRSWFSWCGDCFLG